MKTRGNTGERYNGIMCRTCERQFPKYYMVGKICYDCWLIHAPLKLVNGIHSTIEQHRKLIRAMARGNS
jgi:hypothetical protein